MFSNRNVFSHDPCVIEDGRLGNCEGRPSSVAFIRGLWDLEGRFGAEAPPTKSRSGFSRDPCATDDGRLGIGRSGFIRGLWDLEGRRFGAKAPPTKSDPRVIENQGFEVKASPAKDR
jgi:hypothetical protein